MKNILLYMLFCFLVLVMFSCRRQDSENQEHNSLQTDCVVRKEATNDSQYIDIEIDSGYEYIIPEAKNELDSCISPALRKCIISYIDKYYEKGIDDYCCIYFSKKGTNNYFTIWIYQFPPNRFIKRHYPNESFKYYWFIMHKKEIVLIFNPDKDQLLPFSPCINQLGTLDVTSLPEANPFMIQDRFFYRTYKYIRRDNDFYIEPLRDTIYMGNNKYLGYEIRRLKRENGLPEK